VKKEAENHYETPVIIYPSTRPNIHELRSKIKRSHNQSFCGKAVSIKCHEGVSVALGTQHAMRSRHLTLLSVVRSAVPYFSTLPQFSVGVWNFEEGQCVSNFRVNCV
jgi:hypothetical protein